MTGAQFGIAHRILVSEMRVRVNIQNMFNGKTNEWHKEYVHHFSIHDSIILATRFNLLQKRNPSFHVWINAKT